MWTAAGFKPVMNLLGGESEFGCQQVQLSRGCVHCFSVCFIRFLPKKSTGIARSKQRLDLLERLRLIWKCA